MTEELRPPLPTEPQVIKLLGSYNQSDSSVLSFWTLLDTTLELGSYGLSIQPKRIKMIVNYTYKLLYPLFCSHAGCSPQSRELRRILESLAEEHVTQIISMRLKQEIESLTNTLDEPRIK
jgi:hypothetical protein